MSRTGIRKEARNNVHDLHRKLLLLHDTLDSLEVNPQVVGVEDLEPVGDRSAIHQGQENVRCREPLETIVWSPEKTGQEEGPGDKGKRSTHFLIDLKSSRCSPGT